MVLESGRRNKAVIAKVHVGTAALGCPPGKARQGLSQMMRNDRLAFFFSAAQLVFSMVREWSAPVGCMRSLLAPSTTQNAKH